MNTYHRVIVYDASQTRLLMVKEEEIPFRNKLRFVEGAVEEGEDGESRAYQDLYIKTGIARNQIELVHILDSIDYIYQSRISTYAGKLTAEVEFKESSKICWVKRKSRFSNAKKFMVDSDAETVLHRIEHCKGKVPHFFDRSYVQSIQLTRDQYKEENVYEFCEPLFNMLYEFREDPDVKKALNGLYVKKMSKEEYEMSKGDVCFYKEEREAIDGIKWQTAD